MVVVPFGIIAVHSDTADSMDSEKDIDGVESWQ
jgi:hypothetical protein